MNETTAQKIGLLDGANFQLLVNALLAGDPDYRSLIETGANSQGQAIKSPLDAFCWVPGTNPPFFVLVEHTTIAKRAGGADGNLRTKWKEDLTKAVKQASQLKLDHPQARFRVVLTSSQRPNEPLLNDVAKMAVQGGVDLDIWEQSRIARSLDSTPEGHYLRQKFLGVAAEMLSSSLLRELCQKSLDEYERFITFTGLEIQRAQEAPLQTALAENSRLHFVIGDSGSGKSTLLWRAACKRMDKEGYALWLPAQYVDGKLPLMLTVVHRLRDLCPSLCK